MYRKRALIVGATGIVGLNVAEHLNAIGGWEIFGLSRRRPLGASYLNSIEVDVLDREATAAALADIAPTHVFHCTWTRGQSEDENCRLNGAMLRNVLDALAPKRSVKHLGVVTGTKHYLGPFDNYAKTTPVTPFREEQPRLPGQNFYYVLEDIAAEYGARHDFGWSIHRSHTIIGYAVGNLMNIGATLAAHASICKATGQPFIFPGSPTAYQGLNDITDARLLARHIVWAATEPNARNEAFNAVNGDVFRWSRLWGVIADYFGIVPADYPGRQILLEDQMKGSGPAWDKLVAEHGLQPLTLDRLASPWHTDLDLGRPMECVNSMAKSRRLGFTDSQDSERSFIEVFDRLRRERVIP
ncbi:SDR family oxidoreductase [Labrys neptuniae]